MLPTSTGMAYPRWRLLSGHKEGQPCWRVRSPEMGKGEGTAMIGEQVGGDWIALAGWKASPLLGPFLSWGVRGSPWTWVAIVWLVGNETSI